MNEINHSYLNTSGYHLYLKSFNSTIPKLFAVAPNTSKISPVICKMEIIYETFKVVATHSQN